MYRMLWSGETSEHCLQGFAALHSALLNDEEPGVRLQQRPLPQNVLPGLHQPCTFTTSAAETNNHPLVGANSVVLYTYTFYISHHRALLIDSAVRQSAEKLLLAADRY